MRSSTRKNTRKNVIFSARNLVARRIADDVPGLIVIAAGDYEVGTSWSQNPRVARIVVPMTVDPAQYDWWRPLVDLDALIIPATGVPDRWLTRLVNAVWTGEPRMVWLQDEDLAWRLDRGYALPFSPADHTTVANLAKAIRHAERDAETAEKGAHMLGDSTWTRRDWFA